MMKASSPPDQGMPSQLLDMGSNRIETCLSCLQAFLDVPQHIEELAGHWRILSS